MASGDRFANRVAVIVGAAGGMGRAIAARLAGAGCRLALVDLSETGLAETAAALPGAEIATFPTDITDRAAVDRMAAGVAARFGRCHFLVNAAGTNTKQRTLADVSAEQWERVLAVNLSGVFHCTQALLPVLKEEGGTIVTIVSTAAHLTSPGAGVHYCATKRALLSLTESINLEQGRFGVRACALCPGEVNTPLVDQRPEPPSAARRAAMLQPEDVAEAVHYVLSQPPHVTVTELVVFPTSQISGVYTV